MMKNVVGIVRTNLILMGISCLLFAGTAGASTSVCSAFLDQIQARGLDVQEFLNYPAGDGEPLLHQFVKQNDWDSVAELLKWGADPTVKNKEGKTAYQLADEQGDYEKFIGLAHDFHQRFDLNRIRSALHNLLVPDLDDVVSGIQPASELAAILRKAAMAGETELFRYLVLVKGVSPNSLFEGNRYASRELIFRVWFAALAARDNGSLFNLLKIENFPVTNDDRSDNDLLAMSLGMIDTAKKWEDWEEKAGSSAFLPARYKYSQTSIVPNVENFKYFLSHRGLSIEKDFTLSRALLIDPTDPRSELAWNAIINTPFANKELASQDLATAFTFMLADPVKQHAEVTLHHLAELGVDLKKVEAEYEQQEGKSLLDHARTIEAARFFIQEAGFDPQIIIKDAKTRQANLYEILRQYHHLFGSHTLMEALQDISKGKLRTSSLKNDSHFLESIVRDVEKGNQYHTPEERQQSKDHLLGLYDRVDYLYNGAQDDYKKATAVQPESEGAD